MPQLTPEDVDRMKPAAKLALMADLANRVQRLEELLSAVAAALGTSDQPVAAPTADAPIPKPVLSLAEVAEMLGVSRSTSRAWP